MPTTDQIMEKLKMLLNRRFAIDTLLLDERSRLGDMGIDSLHVVDIMLDIEEELGFCFESLELPSNPSLGEMSAAIAKNALSAQ